MEEHISENLSFQLLRCMTGIIVRQKNMDAKLDWLMIELKSLRDDVVRDIFVEDD